MTQSYPYGGAPAEVAEHIDFAVDLAKNAVDDTTAYIEALGHLLEGLGDLPQIGPVDAAPIVPPGPFQPQAKPDVPGVSEAFPALPVFPGIDDIADIVLPDAPTFDKESPGATAPGEPGPLDVTEPTAPDINTDYTYPDAPTTALPSVPTLEDLDLPTVPTITIEDWDATLPDGTTISPPILTFFWSEDDYTSTLLTDVTAKLITQLQGGTGLDTDIENAIWNRARDREEQTYNKTKAQILIENASRGLTFPDGSIAAKLQEAAQETQDKGGTLSRDIAIKQAELEQENLKIAVSNSMNLEKLNMDYTSQKLNRLLDARKYLQQAGIDIFKAQVSKLSAELDVYKAYSVGFETRLKAALTDLEVYKQQLEGQKLVSDINQQSISIYNAQLDGIKTEVSLYKERIDAIATKVNTEGLKVSVFKSETDAYNSQINAKVAEYNMYESQMKAAMFPMDIYKAEVDAFSSRIRAYGTEVDAQSKRTEAEIANEGFKLDQYKAELQGIMAQIESIVKLYEADSTVYRSATAMYTADIGAEGERYRSETAYNKNIADITLANAEIGMKNADLTLQQALNQLKLASDIVQAQSALASQMAAAALSSLNIGASISGNDNSNYNYSL